MESIIVLWENTFVVCVMVSVSNSDMDKKAKYKRTKSHTSFNKQSNNPNMQMNNPCNLENSMENLLVSFSCWVEILVKK